MWISPYGSIRDHLSMKGNDYGYSLPIPRIEYIYTEYFILIPTRLFFAEISNKIVANVSSGGVMEITAPNEADLKAIDWNKVINMPAYKLYIEVCIRRYVLFDVYTSV